MGIGINVRRSIAALLLSAAPLAAQTPAVHRLTLDDALNTAIGGSEELAIARAGVTRAEGGQRIADSQFLPQINLTAGYTRTILSQYSGITTSSSSSDTSGNSFSSLFKNLPFGQANQWSVGLSLSQAIFAGGKLIAQSDAAAAQRRSADIAVVAANAQLLLSVTQGYFDALLADQLVAIADSSLAQTEEILRQTDLAYRLGAKSEYEMLRAKVSRDNQIPVLLQRRNDRRTAYDRLKLLLNVPLTDSLLLTTNVGDQLPRFTEPSDTSTEARAPVRQAAESVKASKAQIDVAAADRLPTVSLTSQFSPVAYPADIFPTSFSDFHTNWTVGVNVSLPLFTGGRIGGNELVAQGNFDEAQGRLRQARENAALESRTSMNDLEQAQATLNSTTSTSEQATRAYQIAQVQFREGITTQIELADARLLLEQSLANRALALRNVEVARVKLALLRDLPFGSGGAGSSAAAAAAQQAGTSSGSATAGSASPGGATTGGATTGGATGGATTGGLPQ